MPLMREYNGITKLWQYGVTSRSCDVLSWDWRCNGGPQIGGKRLQAL